jgi:hypothetical protein
MAAIDSGDTIAESLPRFLELMAEVDAPFEQNGTEGELGTMVGGRRGDEQAVGDDRRLDAAERYPHGDRCGVEVDRPEDMELGAHPLQEIAAADLE